jgi:hypothetical protein
MELIIIIIIIYYLFKCRTQQPVTNYRVSTNTNNSNMRAQDEKRQKQKMNQFRLLTLKQEFLKILQVYEYILHVRLKHI